MKDDFMAVIEKLNEEFKFHYTPNRERIEAKKKKLETYFQFSKQAGMVTDE